MYSNSNQIPMNYTNTPMFQQQQQQHHLHHLNNNNTGAVLSNLNNDDASQQRPLFGDMIMNSNVLNEHDPRLASHLDLNMSNNKLDPSAKNDIISNNNNTPDLANNATTVTTTNINTNNPVTTSANLHSNSNSSISLHALNTQQQIQKDLNDNNIQNNNNNNSKNNVHNNNNKNQDQGFRNVNSMNKQLYLMTMNNNPHALTDPAIQETLSPFFQPFGVDVSHLPMTNPPIFQSALPVSDEPVRRRRISISNGQIGQLGEDIETVDNIYNTQPPPLPRQYHQNHSRSNSNANGDNHPQNFPINPIPWQNNHNNGSNNNINTNSHDPLYMQQAVPQHQQQYMPQQQRQFNPQFAAQHQQQQYAQQQQKQNHEDYGDEPMPGTTAWKRARLLERNRIAASKCRQRKKIQQLQLQKDFNKLSSENKILKKKLNYYEKLILKFKKFTESHFKNCNFNKNENDDSLKIIQEMLMIDEDIHEINENGIIVKVEKNSSGLLGTDRDV
ncbi:hypothetical protein KAFR_0A02550 [Kazachstania africana CBS 2517]|uniref:BZIP domain-containing protein n=1 Tax=Kazachstania africana (strain ATCC 22294 / BCRC 22015 / CBS 2517 / CECT 1963 / NBRC 1671 / NRRL Y-8276) TaxID=1071382 RepID=H2AMU1_KAZAF|nr:hypothetical protein KAFR_0A02550 [Kazachstania africana CBS 2517]CCF55691.1 hypothetical protein KAFR_0A02550 [Kazachstania africana CBS 2517]